jgi:hypothetical protein
MRFVLPTIIYHIYLGSDDFRSCYLFLPLLVKYKDAFEKLLVQLFNDYLPMTIHNLASKTISPLFHLSQHFKSIEIRNIKVISIRIREKKDQTCIT